MSTRALLALAVLASAAPAWALDGGVCKPDAVKLCPEAVAAKDRKAALACLAKKLDQLSPPCRAKVQEHLPK